MEYIETIEGPLPQYESMLKERKEKKKNGMWSLEQLVSNQEYPLNST